MVQVVLVVAQLVLKAVAVAVAVAYFLQAAQVAVVAQGLVAQGLE